MKFKLESSPLVSASSVENSDGHLLVQTSLALAKRQESLLEEEKGHGGTKRCSEVESTPAGKRKANVCPTFLRHGRLTVNVGDLVS